MEILVIILMICMCLGFVGLFFKIQDLEMKIKFLANRLDLTNDDIKYLQKHLDRKGL